MSVASPAWLIVAVAAAIALVLFWRTADRRRSAALALFASPQLLGDLTASVSARRRALKRALVVAGALLAGIALARPQYGFTWEETQRRGIDVLIALDTSRSMLAQDVAPNRLERAKLAVRDLVDKLGSDRVGLIAFAGSAFLQCPLTLDHAAFLESLDALQPGVIPTPGSDLASALRTAEQALATEQRNVKLLVLFSDGEDLGGGAVAAAQHAAEQGIRVFTVGVGSDSGELIPVPGASGGTEFLKDPQGQFVKSKLDAETLRQVAELTGGIYEPLGRRGEGVAALHDRALAPLPKEELTSRMRRVPIERFQWPLAIALLCLALEPIVRERVTRGAGARAAGAAVVLLATLAASAEAASVREAQRLYAAGKYDEALAEYRAAAGDEPTPQLDFNLGAAAYKAGQFGDAAGAFARALGGEDPKLQQQSFYNLGNAQFRLGEQTRESKPQQTMQAWQQALEAYESALKVDPQDPDARYNRDFVKSALAELQQQQDQQPQQDGDDQQQDQKPQQDGDDQQQQQDEPPQQNDQQQDQPQGGGEPQPTPGQPQKQQPKNDAGEEQKQDEQQPAQGDQGKSDDQQQPGDSQQPSPPQQQPGQMSPEEARDLLDSLKDGEEDLQQLDQNAQQPRRGRPHEQERDW